jgi:hypothetical protein
MDSKHPIRLMTAVNDAIRKCYATAYGDLYDLTAEDGLKANQLAADALAEAVYEATGERLLKADRTPYQPAN